MRIDRFVARAGTRRRVGVALALAVSSAGCIRTEFVQSSPSFVPHETAQRPEVFFDHLPERPYTTVGVIEVVSPASMGLARIFDAAAEKGQEIGCDLVVDGSIHRIGDAKLPRWRTSAVAVEAALPPASAPPPADPRYLGFIAYIPPPPPPPVVVYTHPAPPPDRREFICGVWGGRASGPPEPPPPPPAAPPGQPPAPPPAAPPPS
jgi:hypothetical protein